MRQKAQAKVNIEARRAAVNKGLVQRKSYRQLAKQLDCSVATIAGDVTALRKEWAETRGKADELHLAVNMDVDRWLGQLETLLTGAPGLNKLMVIDRLVKLTELSARLNNLFPKPGTGDEPDVPTGPIKIQFEVLNPGNQHLVQNSQELDGTEDED